MDSVELWKYSSEKVISRLSRMSPMLKIPTLMLHASVLLSLDVAER